MADIPEIPLDQVTEMSRYTPLLKALGYRTVNQFQGAVGAA
jgi:hypothetical protein